MPSNPDNSPNASQQKITPQTQPLKPQRRKLLQTATLLGLGSATLVACGQNQQHNHNNPAVHTRSKKKLTMVTSWPKNLPGLGTAAERVAQRIGEMTENQIQVRVFAAGELVPALQCFDAVAGGAADLYHAAEYYWQSKSPAFNFFSTVPMGMTSAEINGWLNYGGGNQLWQELSGQFGVIAFQAANTGHQMGGWFRKEIRSPDDFRGLKMRIPGLGGNIIREMGGTSQTLPGGEIFQALQTGTIDATEWVGPWNDLALGFHEVTKYYYGPGFHEPGTVLSMGMNRKVWDSLDSYEQGIVRSACAEVNDLSVGEFNWYNAQSLKKLKTDHNIDLRKFPDSVINTVTTIAQDTRADIGRAGGLEAKIHASFENALKSVSDWGAFSDGPFINSRTQL